MTSKTIMLVATLFAVFAAGCSAPLPSSQERFDRAQKYTTERYMEDGYRAQALGDWMWFDQNGRKGLSAKEKVWVDFGIGFLTMIDLRQGIPTLIDGLAGNESGGVSLSVDKIVDIVNNLHTEIIHKSLAERFAAVAADPSFSANMDCNPETFPGPKCPFRGNLDFGDIALFAGITGLTDAILSDLNSHDRLLNLLVDVALNPPAMPEVSNPFRTMPAIIWKVLEDYAQANYGKSFAVSDLLVRTGDGEAVRQQFVKSMTFLRDGFFSTSQESSDQGEEVLPKKNYISYFLERVVGVTDTSMLAMVSLAETTGILTVDRFTAESAAILDSLKADPGDNGQYYLSPFLTGVLDDIKGILPFSLPPSLADMYLPAIWLGGLFGPALAHPMLLLPVSENKSFRVEFEQENYSATHDEVFFRKGGSYEDTGFMAATSTGTPLLVGAGNGVFNDTLGYRKDKNFVGDKNGVFHQSPLTTVTELPNNWVDPVYLFWPDPSFGNVLVPTVQNNKLLETDDTGHYGNAQLNGFVSAIFSIIQEGTAP